MEPIIASHLEALISSSSALRMQRGGRLLHDVLVRQGESPARKAFALHRLCQVLCSTHSIVPHLRGKVPAGPLLLVANHKSYIDPVAIASVIPCAPIAKAEIQSWPLVGTVAARYNTLFVERGNVRSGANALRAAVRALLSGANVLNFPEGTTTAGFPTTFKRGIFGLARLVGLPVVPLSVEFENEELCWIDDQTFVPHYLRSLRAKPHHIELTLGAPLWPHDFASDQAHADAARAAVSQALGRASVKRTSADSTFGALGSLP
jgi:lyso-ornithine lipid O-acyltransferase